MQKQYTKLLEFSDELTSNPMVGGRSSITMETRDLRGDWERLKDNVMDSLALLQREYDDLVRGREIFVVGVLNFFVTWV